MTTAMITVVTTTGTILKTTVMRMMDSSKLLSKQTMISDLMLVHLAKGTKISMTKGESQMRIKKKSSLLVI